MALGIKCLSSLILWSLNHQVFCDELLMTQVKGLRGHGTRDREQRQGTMVRIDCDNICYCSVSQSPNFCFYFKLNNNFPRKVCLLLHVWFHPILIKTNIKFKKISRCLIINTLLESLLCIVNSIKIDSNLSAKRTHLKTMENKNFHLSKRTICRA